MRESANSQSLLHKRAIFLVVAIFLLLIASIVFTFQLLEAQDDDGVIINVSGRQRMLSQKITKSCLQLSINPADSASKHNLLKDLSILDSNFNFIVGHRHSENIDSALDKLMDDYSILRKNAESILIGNPEKAHVYLRVIMDVEPTFLRQMDDIVNLFEAEYNRKQQRAKVYLVSGAVFISLFLLFMILFVIIPEIKRTSEQKQQLQRFNDELNELNDTKDLLFKIVAHDLRNPIANLQGLADLLSKTYSDLSEEDIEMYLSMIDKQSKSTFNLLNNLLEWARVQSDVITFNPVLVSIQSEMFDELAVEMSSLASSKNLTLNLNTDASLMATADKNMLRTILRNLISNALKFTHANGKVTVTAKAAGDDTVFSVSDDGVGMSDDQRKKLFSANDLVSMEGTSNEQGTGLGLVLCKDLVDKHGGKIWVESSLGAGTTFKFSLPN